MRFKTTFNLFVTVCLLGGLLFLVDYRSRVKQKKENENHLIFDVATDPVIGIKIVSKENKIECIKKGSDWFLKEPVRARGNAAAIERIAAMLEDARWTESISVDQRKLRGLDLGDYGLKSPRFVITVETELRGMVLFIGDELPMGNGLYARRDHSDEVLIVPEKLGRNLPSSIETLRDHSVLHGTPEKTVRVEIERKGAGFIQLVKQNGVWMIQQPLSARADAVEVQLLLKSLYNLKVEKYFWDVRTNPLVASKVKNALDMDASARIESCGLAADAVQMRITVWVSGDSLGQELMLGKADPKNKGTLFAKRGKNDAIFGVKDEILKRCSVDLNLLRDRRVYCLDKDNIGYIGLRAGEKRLILERDLTPLSNWGIVDPVKWDADNKQVNELLDRLGTLTVFSYFPKSTTQSNSVEISEANCSVVLRASAPVKGSLTKGKETPAGGGELLIGGVCKNKECYYAKMADRDEVFMLKASDVDWLQRQKTMSPLFYRNRCMLKVDPKNVSRIDVTTPSETYDVDRISTQNWSCVVNQQSIPDLYAIRNILILTSNLRAVSIVEHNPESLEKYGLDSLFSTVTLGLRGEGNIQKSILIGKQSDEGLYYAMIRGQDIVFMISKDMVSKLLATICIASDSAGAAIEEDK